MNLRLKKNVYKAKEVISVMSNFVPGAFFVKFVKSYYDNKKLYEGGSIDYDAINNVISTMPNTAQEYLNFNESAYSKDVFNLYNEALIKVKEQSELSESILNKYDCDNAKEIENLLQSLYAQGKNGDLDAQTQFTGLMDDYTNDIYQQAYDMASEDYTDLILSNSNFPHIDLSFTDVLQTMSKEDIFMGICSLTIIGLSYITYDYIFGKTKKKHDKEMNGLNEIELQIKS